MSDQVIPWWFKVASAPFLLISNAADAWQHWRATRKDKENVK